MNNRGLTLVEVIIVVIIVAVLGTILAPEAFKVIERSRISTDLSNLKTLNKVTPFYAYEMKKEEDIFEGFEDDNSKIEELFEKGFLEKIIKPKVKDSLFIWDINTQKWYYISEKAPILSNSYIFSKMEMTDFTFNSWGGGGGSTWSITEKGIYSTGANAADLVFIKNERSEYVLKTKFQLNEHTSNVGGLGIFFETTLDSSDKNKDTGYILQFDRGFSEIVIRSRVNGSESSSQGAQILARIGSRSTSTVFHTSIPHNSNSDWWQSEKELTISVRSSDTIGEKYISVSLDGEILLNDFSIDSNINSENNNSGFRAWNGAPVTVESLIIE